MAQPKCPKCGKFTPVEGKTTFCSKCGMWGQLTVSDWNTIYDAIYQAARRRKQEPLDAIGRKFLRSMGLISQ